MLVFTQDHYKLYHRMKIIILCLYKLTARLESQRPFGSRIKGYFFSSMGSGSRPLNENQVRSFSDLDFSDCRCYLILTAVYTQILYHCYEIGESNVALN